jgi:CRP-like cAMP-binding protein
VEKISLPEETLLKHLLSLPRFSELSLEELKKIVPWIQPVKGGKEEVIFQANDPPEFLFFIIEGRIKLFRPLPQGKKITLGIFQRGEMIGEVAVVEQIPYPATATSLTPFLLLSIPGDGYLLLLKEHPSFALSTIRDLSRRIFYLTQRVYGNAGSVPFRVARVLATIAFQEGYWEKGNLIIPLHFRKKDLSHLASVRVETLVRIFTHLKEENILEEEEKKVKILNFSAFAELADLGEEEQMELFSLRKRGEET